jgi:hypothetical protein
LALGELTIAEKHLSALATLDYSFKDIAKLTEKLARVKDSNSKSM